MTIASRRARALLLFLLVLPALLSAQFSGKDRRRGELMLQVTLDDIRRRFWDPTLKGVDLDSLEAAAKADIAAATSNAQINGIIAKIFLALDDSHTRFFPPSFAGRLELGWTGLPIGDSIYVVEVKRNSPADSAGLKVGDRIVSVEGWQVERARWGTLIYVVRTLQPRDHLAMVIQRGEEAPRALDVPTTFIPGRRFYDLSAEGGGTDWYQIIRESESRYVGWDSRFVEIGDSTLYWRLRTFAVSPDFIRECLRRARGRQTLIIDLRDNPGGLVVSLNALVDRIARADQVGDTVIRVRERDRVRATVVERVRDSERFTGRVIVLINYGSASASEAFADAVQRLERGTVLGDRSGGYLTMAVGLSHQTPGEITVTYGASVAIAMLERPDGSRIEGHGVIPDELITPDVEDLLGDRDPVLARALQIVTGSYDPQAAWVMAEFGGDYVHER